MKALLDRQPDFTIVTPSYNQAKFIARTIESVLQQGIENIEYLVFDGGSTDDTVEVLKRYGDALHWISEPDRGQTHAVNKGFSIARGKIIGWLNSDDIYYPGALRAVKAVFDQNPQIHILYGLADHIDEVDKVIESYYCEEWDYRRLQDVCFICQPAVFFRRSILESFGLLDEDLRFCMDYEYWLRIGREVQLYHLKMKLAGSRIYQDTKTAGSAVAVHEEILKMFKKKVGKIPSYWIYNHAHVVARHAGLRQDTPDNNWQFVKKLVYVAVTDALRYRHYLTTSEMRTLVSWVRHARKALMTLQHEHITGSDKREDRF